MKAGGAATAAGCSRTGAHTHTQTDRGKEEGARPGEEPKPPCAGPPAGPPERPEAGSRRAGAARSGRAPPGEAQRARCWRSQGGGTPLSHPRRAPRSAGRRQRPERRGGDHPPHTPSPSPPPGRVGSGRRYLQSPSSRSRVPFMSRMRLARAGTGCMARSSSSQRATSAYMARMLRSAASPRLSTPSR